MRMTKILWVAVSAMFLLAIGAAIWGPGPELRPEVRVRVIAVKADLSKAGDVERARRKIDQIYEHLEKGANFEQLAINESEAASASEGGDMGWVGRGALPEQLEDVAFSLEPGQYSDIMTHKRVDDLIYRILYVEERRNF